MDRETCNRHVGYSIIAKHSLINWELCCTLCISHRTRGRSLTGAGQTGFEKLRMQMQMCSEFFSTCQNWWDQFSVDISIQGLILKAGARLCTSHAVQASFYKQGSMSWTMTLIRYYPTIFTKSEQRLRQIYWMISCWWFIFAQVGISFTHRGKLVVQLPQHTQTAAFKALEKARSSAPSSLHNKVIALHATQIPTQPQKQQPPNTAIALGNAVLLPTL